jgi:hypothetical protein
MYKEQQKDSQYIMEQRKTETVSKGRPEYKKQIGKKHPPLRVVPVPVSKGNLFPHHPPRRQINKAAMDFRRIVSVEK